MSVLVSIDRHGDIAIIKVNNPPVNAITRKVRAELLIAFESLETDQTINRVILMCLGKTFFSGGDITEFDGTPPEPHLPEVVQRIENSSKITIAAMHENCLGGGLEIALACDFRLALDSTRFAFPEVNLGLIPGAGGSQRLPRLIGLAEGASMLATGKTKMAKEMLELGALDKIVHAPLEASAVRFAQTQKAKPVPVSKREVKSADLTALEANHQKGQLAPLLNIKAASWSVLEPYETAQPNERRLHLELRQSPQSKALRYVFAAQSQAAKPILVRPCEPKSLEKIAVIGGGLMGAGIAISLLTAGKSLKLLERNHELAQKAKAHILGELETFTKKGKINTPTETLIRNLTVTHEVDSLRDSDLVIEAVFEDLDVKRAVFHNLVNAVHDHAILTTNTSYIDPKIIVPRQYYNRTAGLHFFSPAHIMKLVEVVKIDDTSDQVLATLFKFVRDIRKQPVQTAVCDGFIGNRILAQYRREADYLLADGALPTEIDRAMRAFGMPLGPYEVQDLSGLQIAWAHRKRQSETRPDSMRYVDIADQLCEAKRFGKKSGGGWYDYSDGKKMPSPFVEKTILDYAEKSDIQRGTFDAATIQQRLIAVMFNEAQLILEEGIAERPSDIDVVKIAGYGFPRWTGGPVYYGERHLHAMKAAMNDVANQSPNSWKIATRLR